MRKFVWSLFLPFVEFLQDLGSTWVGLMSGIVGVCLWAFGAWVEPVPISLRWSFLVLAAPAVVIACFLGWLKRQPQLIGQIDQTILGQPSGSPTSTLVVLVVNVRNTGMPSIVHEWEIHIELGDGRKIKGINEVVGNRPLFQDSGPARIIVPGQEPSVPVARRITEEDAMYNKAKHPIPSGGMIRGFLVASFPGIPQKEFCSPETKIIVKFTDVWERRHSCFHVLGKNFVPIGQAEYYPM